MPVIGIIYSFSYCLTYISGIDLKINQERQLIILSVEKSKELVMKLNNEKTFMMMRDYKIRKLIFKKA